MGVYCNAGRENAVASTKAFTTQVTVLALIAIWFKDCRIDLLVYLQVLKHNESRIR